MLTFLIAYLAYAIGLSAVIRLAGHRGLTGAAGGSPRGRLTRVLIVGATGGTGRQLVTQALERGHDVTALVRDRSRLPIEHPRLTVVQGDVLDPASVDAAVRGQDAVLSALGHKRFFGPTRILSEGTRNLLRAMDTHGVSRLVCETSLGIGDSAGRMGLYYTLFVIPVILPFYFWDKARQERLIAASATEWVIVRPGMLISSDQRRVLRSGRGVGSFLRTVRVSRVDVAGFMLDQLATDAYVRTSPGVCW